MIKNRFLRLVAALSLAAAMFVMNGCDKKTSAVTGNGTTNPPATVTEFS